MMGKIVGRLLWGRNISPLAAWQAPTFSASWWFFIFIFVFVQEIETFHLRERNRCNEREIATECPLNVEWIEIQGKTREPDSQVWFLSNCSG